MRSSPSRSRLTRSSPVTATTSRLELPITFDEAVLGAKVDVPTIHGSVSMTIPPGASSGQRLRLKGKGIKRGQQGGRSDRPAEDRAAEEDRRRHARPRRTLARHHGFRSARGPQEEDMSLDERNVVARIERLTLRELRLWVREGWVRPAQGERGPVFDEIDVARLRLLCDLRKDMALPADAMPTVLTLIDELHRTRRDLQAPGRGARRTAGRGAPRRHRLGPSQDQRRGLVTRSNPGLAPTYRLKLEKVC